MYKWIFFATVLIYVSCQLKPGKIDIYNEKYYREIKIFTDSQRNIIEYRTFINIYDTNRIMLKYFWDNGNLQAVGFYLNKRKDGKWKMYFENGNISYEGIYKNGKKNGNHISYDSSSKVLWIKKYKEDIEIKNTNSKFN